jgi:hypothetical protein
MQQRVLDLRLTPPGIDFRKAVDIAGWFHCHFFFESCNGQVFKIKAENSESKKEFKSYLGCQ